MVGDETSDSRPVRQEEGERCDKVRIKKESQIRERPGIFTSRKENLKCTE